MTRLRSRRKKKEPLHLVATCGAGLENILKQEIISLGGVEPRTTPGAVSWQASNLQSAYKACLWSRFASRILLQLAQFEAADPEALYEQASKIDWSLHFSNRTTFAVYCTLVKAELSHSHYASLKIKDAIVDQFRKRTGKRPNVDAHKPGIRINLHVEGTSATLALDLSGDSLHRRGYRTGSGEAPLKETLAAAIVHLAGVRPDMPAESCLLDPMCGSGTLLIEAALILGDSAPGLLRKNFGFMYWHRHNKKLWDKLVADALEREDRQMDRPWPTIIGYDADPKVVAIARKNIINAGLKDRIIIKQRQLARLKPPMAQGILVTNAPFGERLSEKESVKYLYRCLGRIFRLQFPGWQLGFFTANPDLADMLGVPWQQRHRLYNGPIKCRLLTAVSPGGTEEEPHVRQLEDNCAELPARDFCNRVRKNCQSLLPWARENRISCFRIYDADIPEYNLAIDLYEQWVHVQEYAAPDTINPDTAKERFNHALHVIRSLLTVPHSNLFIKTRNRQRGKQQQRKNTGSGKLYEVHEGGGRFLVSFTDERSTGLFPDQRKIRTLLGSLASGRTFLNLYAHTGSATVSAAGGGAVSTMTVGLSEKNLGRARANLSLNGYGGPLHRFQAGDGMQWLRSCRERYGLIFVHPPTVYTALDGRTTVDLRHDHAPLLQQAMDRLSRDGILIFACTAKKFRLDPELELQFKVTDIGVQVTTRDFRRSQQCWQFRHK